MDSQKQRYDFLIIGQGIAGSCLSYQLIKRGQKVKVVDNGSPNAASKAAAGLFNPVTGRKMVKTWLADSLFSYLIPFYLELEGILETKFLHIRNIYRPFKTIEEYNEWCGNSSENEFDHFISEISPNSKFSYLHDQNGGLMLKNSGFLDIKSFLRAFRNYLTDKEILIEDELVTEDISKSSYGILYKGMVFDRMIYCSGTQTKDTPFEHLKFRPVKGEVLELQPQNEINEDFIYNKGCFMLKSPESNDNWWLGSTYHHQNLNFDISEKAKNELTDKLEKMYKAEYKIVNQWAGIRPATYDRKPLIGMHPEENRIGIFNGLGAKGVSLAPYFSEHFVRFLLDNESIDKNVDIMRNFTKL